MSEIMLNVLDADRTCHGSVHGSVGNRIVAALAADPATIDELGRALGRYMRTDRYLQSDGSHAVFHHWKDGISHDPWEAGIVYIDLVGRLVVGESTYSSHGHRGTVDWHDGDSATKHCLPFSLAADWFFSEHVHGFEPLSAQRRAEYAGIERIDERSVLFDGIPAFMVSEMAARHASLADMDKVQRYQLVRSIHARWMMTAREDLSGRSPRDVAIDDRHEHLNWDLQNQEHYWSILRQPPPGIPRASIAYRFGGFGTHELVLYYNMVRTLLEECFDQLRARPVGGVDEPAIVDHLQQLRQEWMHTPNYDDSGAQTPAAMIDRERRRIPECDAFDGHVHDDQDDAQDCPFCQLSEQGRFGPGFWHLDGCNMDEDFAFSFHRKLEEWQQDQIAFEEFTHRFEEEQRRKRDLIGGWPAGGDGFDDEVPY